MRRGGREEGEEEEEEEEEVSDCETIWRREEVAERRREQGHNFPISLIIDPIL